MKSLSKNLLASFALVLLTTFGYELNAQDKAAVHDVKLSVSKLMLGTKDITDSLATVNIEKNTWIEYDRHGTVIGKATIVKNKDKEIHIKWISATNGAKKDAITIYKVAKEGNKYTFDIYFDDKKQGYFIASSE
jgi:uncharacterized protein YuzE